jgi:hypothetical protein
MKKMLLDDLKAVCSITEMADKLGLSRIRFYQLREKGVFPGPVDLGCPKRSCYTLDLQRECIEIRKTGIGHNGEPIIFNATRKRKSKKSKKKPRRQPYPLYEQLADILRNWGRNITHLDVKNTVNTLYPDGLAQDPDEGMILRDLIDYFDKGQ